MCLFGGEGVKLQEDFVEANCFLLCSSLSQQQPVNSELFKEARGQRGGAKTEGAVNGITLFFFMPGICCFNKSE